MLDPTSEAMGKEIEEFSQHLQAVIEQLRECGKLSANQAALDGIQQHKDPLAAKLANAVRTSTWGSVRTEFGRDWNSLVADVEQLELQLYE